jgi:hypothetical protein
MHRSARSLAALLFFGCTNPQEPANATQGLEDDGSSSVGGASTATTPPASSTDPGASTSGDDESTRTATSSDGTSSSGSPDATSSSSSRTDADSDSDSDATDTSTQSDGDSSTESSSGEVFEPFDFDDFDDPAGIDDWYLRDAWEGTPAQYTTLDFDVTNPGAMTLVPSTSGWFNDYDGPFVFRLVSGDFMIETYVTVTGLIDPDGPPTQTYNSAGLMLRDPANVVMGEDWVVHNTGYQEFGVESEGKITIDSSSTLTTTPGAAFGRLRICRFGGDIAVVRWLDGDAGWIDTTDPYPDLLPLEVQAGMAVTAWNSTGNTPDFDEDPDMIAVWDYVAFYEIDDMSRCYEG